MESGDTRTAFEQVETLHLLLETVGIDPPFVFVGHSIAGLTMVGYPHLYPDEIAGLVFVDASHPDQWERFAEVDPSQGMTTEVVGQERLDLVASIEELSAVEDFDDLPIAVLLRARPADDEMRAVWVLLQEDHATRSTNSQLIPAEASGHFVHNDEPELVVDAIMWVLEEAQADLDDTE